MQKEILLQAAELSVLRLNVLRAVLPQDFADKSAYCQACRAVFRTGRFYRYIYAATDNFAVIVINLS